MCYKKPLKFNFFFCYFIHIFILYIHSFYTFNNYSLKSRWIVAKYLPSRESGEVNISKATIHRDWENPAKNEAPEEEAVKVEKKVKAPRHKSREIWHLICRFYVKYWWNISVLKSVSPCRIFVIEKLSVGTITMSLVGNTICHHEKKKKRKEKKTFTEVNKMS